MISTLFPERISHNYFDITGETEMLPITKFSLLVYLGST